MKQVLGVFPKLSSHWVGDGFPVQTIFSFHKYGNQISPFLLLDYAGPVTFPPSSEPRGVDEHPHRGFETVTIVYQGEVEHRDSAGNKGRIGPGDVQWMTAASGIVHEEKHAQAFTATGGTMEMAQLWVNLPKDRKMSPPNYQTILTDQIPTVNLPGGSVRVIAGAFEEAKGPAHTFTPMNVWDVRLHGAAAFDIQDGYVALLIVLRGSAQIGTEKIGEAEFALLSQEGEGVKIEGNNATMLLLSGQPINEPIASYGPFVMNTEGEIRQAILDYQTGKMGHVAV